MAAQADTTLDYDVIFFGKKSGSLATVIRDDGRRHVTFTYRDNGRGPDIEEDIALLADGTFRSYRQRGRTTFGAKLDERFEIAGDKASWRSPAENGQKSLAGPAVYLPVYGSPEASAVVMRATQKAGGRLAALPGGELRSEKLATAQVGAPGQQREVALYALFGARLQPEYAWLEAGGDMNLFAYIVPGYTHLIAAGHGAEAAKLEQLQREAERAPAGRDRRQTPPGPAAADTDPERPGLRREVEGAR